MYNNSSEINSHLSIVSVVNLDLTMAEKPNGVFIWKKIMGTVLTMVNLVVKYYHSCLPDIFMNVSEKSIFISLENILV